MNNTQKTKIQQAMIAKIEKLGISQSLAAKMIGVSGATITNVKNNKWTGITDAWRKIGQWVGNGSWQIVETANLKGILQMCQHSQEQGISKALSYRQGSGKSCGAKYYAANTKNAFYLECEPHYTKKVFLQKLSKVMGISVDSGISDMVDSIIDRLNSLDKPLVILDEFDQLSERVLPFFKTFYNKANCGFVLIGGEHFPKRILKGVRLAKQSYCEIFSRMGAEFLSLHAINDTMIQQICEANGVYDKSIINSISKAAKGDLRRVKNDIEKAVLANQRMPKHN